MPGPIEMMKRFSIGGPICVDCGLSMTLKEFTEEELEDWRSSRVCKRCAEALLVTASLEEEQDEQSNTTSRGDDPTPTRQKTK